MWGGLKSGEKLDDRKSAHAFNQAEFLMKSDLSSIDYTKFRTMLDDQKIYDELTFMLLEKLQKKSKRDSAKKYKSYNELREEVLFVLKWADAGTFRKLLADEITLKQAKARLNGLHKNFHYVVLDDLVDKLGEDLGGSHGNRRTKDRCKRSLTFNPSRVVPMKPKATEARKVPTHHPKTPNFKGITAEMNKDARREAKAIVACLDMETIEAYTKGTPGYQSRQLSLLHSAKSMPKLLKYHLKEHMRSQVPR